MKPPNVFLAIVDCLRKDYVVPGHMPWLSRFGQNFLSFENYWGSSHCTDPSITHLLSGRHPDDLRLYSMMYNDKKFTIPEETELLMHKAKAAGYTTATVTNLQRWYHWASDYPKNTRQWPLGMDFRVTMEMMNTLPEPWFVFFHCDTMHMHYAGGSYQAAAKFTDRRLEQVARAAAQKDAAIFITSDHGEGLGQSGPDGHAIDQHGYGLWDFLTHIPLVVKLPDAFPKIWENGPVPELMGHDQLHGMILNCFSGNIPNLLVPKYVFQAGATPSVFHRGVVTRSGKQFVRAIYLSEEDDEGNREEERREDFWIGKFRKKEKAGIEAALDTHCKLYHGSPEDVGEEAIVMDRLKGLGYFG